MKKMDLTQILHVIDFFNNIDPNVGAYWFSSI